MNKKHNQKFVQNNYKTLPKKLKVETNYLVQPDGKNSDSQHIIQQVYQLTSVPEPVLPSELQYYQYMCQKQDLIIEQLHLKLMSYLDFCTFIRELFSHGLQYLYVANLFQMDVIVAMMWMKIYCMMIISLQKSLYVRNNVEMNKFVQIVYSMNDQFDLEKLYRENARMRNEEDKQIRDVLFLDNQQNDDKNILLQHQQFPYNHLTENNKFKPELQNTQLVDKIIISQKIVKQQNNKEFEIKNDNIIQKLNNFAFHVQDQEYSSEK